MSGAIRSWRDLSGDSTVHELSLGSGDVRFVFEDEDSNETLEVVIETDSAIIRPSGSVSSGSSIHPVAPRLLNVADLLRIDEATGVFVAPNLFAQLMKATRDGAHLALGRRAAEWPFVFQLIGYDCHLACPIRSEDDIRISAQ